MVRKSDTRLKISIKKLVALVLIVIIFSVLISLIIWKSVFDPGSLVRYKETKTSSDKVSEKGGGSSVGIGIIHNKTNKTLNFTTGK